MMPQNSLEVRDASSAGAQSLRVLQINIGECRLAHNLMIAVAKLNADIVAVSEPNKSLAANLPSCYTDSGRRAALFTVGDRARITDIGPDNEEGFRWLRVAGTRIYSCYWPPCKRPEDFARYEDFLNRLEASVRSGSGPVVIAGDFNAKSPEWGDPREDDRGRALADLMASVNLVACNDGEEPTFERVHRTGVSTSHIDVTFISEPDRQRLKNWRVREEPSGSLHNYISFELQPGLGHLARSNPGLRWAWRKADLHKLSLFLQSNDAMLEGDAEAGASALGRHLTEACDASMPRGNYKGGKKPVYWWTEGIADLRRECLKTRRALKRGRRRGTAITVDDPLGEAYKAARRALNIAVKKSKRDCWSRLCNQVENDPWGLPYRLVTKKLIGRAPIPELERPGRMESIVETLFPSAEVSVWPPPVRGTTFPEVTVGEIVEASRRIPHGRAPGPDGIPDFVVKHLAKEKPQLLKKLYNSCFYEGIFPEKWKVAKLVLLRKGYKPLDQPSSYRPICLLDSSGKLLERVIKERLEKHLESVGGLHARQFGFRKGCSTIDAIAKVMEVVNRASTGPLHKRELCALIALDVANAFNSARWPEIEAALVDKRVPLYLLQVLRSYLSTRTLRYGEDNTRRVTCGVPQGSVLGPLLWNVMYDGLLSINLGENTPGFSSSTMVAFADDVGIVVTGHNTRLLEVTANNALSAVSDWMGEKGLRLSAQKTEAVVLTNKRKYDEPSFLLDGVIITPVEELRYLGVELSRKLGFKAHLKAAAAKAANTARALSRLLPNVSGPRQQKRHMLATVVHSQLLYAAPVWVGALSFASNINILLGPQRTMALRVSMAYRTVSTGAVLVVAGLIPVHLLAQERAEVRCGRGTKEEVRGRTFQRWQLEWGSANKGAWTRRLIHEVEPWVRRKGGQTDFHLTQMFTGHGCFNSYLHRIGKAEHPSCSSCGVIPDDAEHTFFRCDRWENQRRNLEARLGGLDPDTLVQRMKMSQENWEAVRAFVSAVLTKKEEEERVRQAAAVAPLLNA